MTIDRGTPASDRRTLSQNAYIKETGYTAKSNTELDEYPQALFLENGGSADVKPINDRDNSGSGANVAAQIWGGGTGLQGYTSKNPLFRNGDNIEIYLDPKNTRLNPPTDR